MCHLQCLWALYSHNYIQLDDLKWFRGSDNQHGHRCTPNPNTMAQAPTMPPVNPLYSKIPFLKKGSWNTHPTPNKLTCLPIPHSRTFLRTQLMYTCKCRLTSTPLLPLQFLVMRHPPPQPTLFKLSTLNLSLLPTYHAYFSTGWPTTITQRLHTNTVFSRTSLLPLPLGLIIPFPPPPKHPNKFSTYCSYPFFPTLECHHDPGMPSLHFYGFILNVYSTYQYGAITHQLLKSQLLPHSKQRFISWLQRVLHISLT